MPNLTIDFTPPEDPDYVALHVEEAPTAEGIYDALPAIVVAYPYPTKVRVNVTNANDWFRVRWENSSGGFTPYSDPVPGGVTTFISKVINRVMLRMPNADESIITQEAETVIESVLGVDPYDQATDLKYRTWSGLTLLTMARVQLSSLIAQTGQSASFTAGLVSMKTDSKTALTLDGINDMIRTAMGLLGLRTGVVAQMVVDMPSYALPRPVMADISRLRIDVE